MDELKLTQIELAALFDVHQSAISSVKLKMVGISDVIQLTKLEGERKVPYQIEKWKEITSHTARRSFITNMSILGLNQKQISMMSGHSDVKMVDLYDKTQAEVNAVNVLQLIGGKV